MAQLFITGMLRSGTTLIQTLLTNHPQLFVGYQPFYQFYLECKQRFLDIQGINRFLPLGDGLEDSLELRSQLNQWLEEYVYSEVDVATLMASATQAKGGGARELDGLLHCESGTFIDLHAEIHHTLASRYKPEAKLIGAKEVLCEEYLRCLIIIRDPRAVIASASFGRYRDSVGDRYPILMLIRLWRKSAAYWLKFQTHPLVHVLRYEDLVAHPTEELEKIRMWLELSPFLSDLINQPLKDHRGQLWKGNSSFEDKHSVQAFSVESWKTLLRNDEISLIEACTMLEMRALGYEPINTGSVDSIEDFVEDIYQVRHNYLEYYEMNNTNKTLELQRCEFASANNYVNPPQAPGLFLFPEVFQQDSPHPAPVGRI